MLHLGFSQDLVLEIATQFIWRPQIHFSAPQQIRQFEFHTRELKVAGNMAWFEFHQEINVALRPEVVSQRRAEQREFAYVMPPAEPLDYGVGHFGSLRINMRPHVLKLNHTRNQRNVNKRLPGTGITEG